MLERTLLLDALPAVKRENPRAVEIIRRLIMAILALSATISASDPPIEIVYDDLAAALAPLGC